MQKTKTALFEIEKREVSIISGQPKSFRF